MMSDDLSTAILYFLMALAAYFLPSLVASSRRHKNKNAIYVTNTFLGWTFVGWIAALIWANTDNVMEKKDNGKESKTK